MTLAGEQADRRPLYLFTLKERPSPITGTGYIVLLTLALTGNFGQLRDQALAGVKIDRATFAAVTASCVSLSLAGDGGQNQLSEASMQIDQSRRILTAFVGGLTLVKQSS